MSLQRRMLPRPLALRGSVVGMLLLAALLAACGPSASSAPPEPSATNAGSAGRTPGAGTPSTASTSTATTTLARLVTVVDGLAAPTAVTNAGDGSGRLFVLEQAGRIRVVEDGRLRAAPFLDIASRVASGGERGLLGLAFHPGFPRDPRLFVDYTDSAGNTVIASFTAAAGSAGTADPGSERILLHIDQPFPNHNGGQVAFGPDGFLYIGMGDGGSGGDPYGNGQRTDTLLGKILRIDVDHDSVGLAYAIPADNPFAPGSARSGAGRPEIWAIGLRNPWRFSFDSSTGSLWIGDVGQDRWEEIDRIPAGTKPPVNLGWNRMEGTHCYRPADGCDTSGVWLPIADYGHDQGCAVTGGYVARAAAAGAFAGRYVFGDYCSGNIWTLDADGPDRQEPALLLRSGHMISAFGLDEAGAILVCDLSSGELLRLVSG